MVQKTLTWFKTNTSMVQKHLHGSKQTRTWLKTNTYIVQNKRLYGSKQTRSSKQTLIWFKKHMVQNKHLHG
jgi:arsenate reductase-like glutaredoxin family protein